MDSTDPAGFVNGPNLYIYCFGNPITYDDKNGMDSGTVYASPDYDYLRDPRKEAEARSLLEGVYTSRVKDPSKRFVIEKMHFVTETQSWLIDKWSLVSKESNINKSLGNSQGAELPNADEGANQSSQEAPGTATEGSRSQQSDGSTRPSDPREQPAAAHGTSTEAPPSEPPGVVRPTGQAAVTTWDSIQRGRYVSENIRASHGAQQAIEAAHRGGDAGQGWQKAEEVSRLRDARRVSTQGRLSPGGRAMSQAIEEARDFGKMVQTYSSRLPSVEGGVRTRNRYSYEIARRIAVGAGESRASIKALARFGRVAGPVGVALGVGLGVHAYLEAPEDQKGRVAAGETGSFVGGAIGASVGMSAGVALAGGISGFLVGLGVVAGPIGWLAIGLGLLGAVAVGARFSHRGSQVGEAVYDAADRFQVATRNYWW